MTNLLSSSFATLTLEFIEVADDYLGHYSPDIGLPYSSRNNRVTESTQTTVTKPPPVKQDNNTLASSPEVSVESSNRPRLAQAFSIFNLRVRRKFKKVFRFSHPSRRGAHVRLHRVLRAKTGLVSFPRFEEQEVFEDE